MHVWFQLNCCGIVNYGDWLSYLGIIPGSCCVTTETICQPEQAENVQGCLVPVTDIFLNYLYFKNRLICITMALLVLYYIFVFLIIFYSHTMFKYFSFQFKSNFNLTDCYSCKDTFLGVIPLRFFLIIAGNLRLEIQTVSFCSLIQLPVAEDRA